MTRLINIRASEDDINAIDTLAGMAGKSRSRYMLDCALGEYDTPASLEERLTRLEDHVGINEETSA